MLSSSRIGPQSGANAPHRRYAFARLKIFNASRGIILVFVFALWSGLMALCGQAHAECSPMEGWVAVNGVRLQYLDWGGSGPALVLIPGLGDDPHIFNYLAPAFTHRFHVIAYARRGFGGSEGSGPYDIGTLTDDLAGVMDALGVSTASLVGVSAGADEMTEMAVEHPERVISLIYLEGAYDWADEDFHAAVDALPGSAFERPASATASFEAYLSYQRALWFPDLPDARRIEALMRQKTVIERDGRVEERTPAANVKAHQLAMWTHPPRNYRAVECPALAIYLTTMYDPHTKDLPLRERARVWEEKYWKPFQKKSMARARRDLSHLTIVQLPGAHVNFLIMEPTRVIPLMQHFLAQATITRSPK